MANKYYYLVSSLPLLVLEELHPITSERFVAECEKWLTPDELEIIKNIGLDNYEISPDDPFILRQWKGFDSRLRKALAEVRKMLKVSPQEPVPPFLRDVFKEPTPLAMEQHLAQRRWEFIDEAEFGYHFDLNRLILYYLKLKILERLASFDKEKGKEKFTELCEVGYE